MKKLLLLLSIFLFFNFVQATTEQYIPLCGGDQFFSGTCFGDEQWHITTYIYNITILPGAGGGTYQPEDQFMADIQLYDISHLCKLFSEFNSSNLTEEDYNYIIQEVSLYEGMSISRELLEDFNQEYSFFCGEKKVILRKSELNLWWILLPLIIILITIIIVAENEKEGAVKDFFRKIVPKFFQQ